MSVAQGLNYSQLCRYLARDRMCACEYGHIDCAPVERGACHNEVASLLDLVTAPHALFTVWSPDECAECLDGVSAALSSRIWRDIVPLYDGKPRSEVPDDFSSRSVYKFWHLFTEPERLELNAAAVALDR